MSFDRRTNAPFSNPIAPDGTKLCKCGCEKPVTDKGRKSWASDDCVERFKIANWPQHVRMRLLARDHGVCRLCGRDMERAERRYDLAANFSRWSFIERAQRMWRHGRVKDWLRLATTRREIRMRQAGQKRRDAMRLAGFPTHIRTSWWAADHIVPVAEGGGQPDSLDAYRTLCLPCHWVETAKLRKRLAKPKHET